MHGITYARSAPAVAIDPDAKIRIIYEKTPEDTWIQTTVDTATGKTLQKYPRGKAKKTQFEFSTEMQYGNKGTTSAQVYTDTVITLAQPDLGFGKGKQKVNGAVSGITSEEGGKVWKIARCDIPAMRQGDNHPATGKEL